METQVYQAGAVLRATQAFLVTLVGLVIQALVYQVILVIVATLLRLKVQ